MGNSRASLLTMGNCFHNIIPIKPIRPECCWSEQDCQHVPEDEIFRDPNRHAAPVVRWCEDRGETKIRCYPPGGGV
jgi:hypothetical protein